MDNKTPTDTGPSGRRTPSSEAAAAVAIAVGLILHVGSRVLWERGFESSPRVLFSIPQDGLGVEAWWRWFDIALEAALACLWLAAAWGFARQDPSRAWRRTGFCLAVVVVLGVLPTAYHLAHPLVPWRGFFRVTTELSNAAFALGFLAERRWFRAQAWLVPMTAFAQALRWSATGLESIALAAFPTQLVTPQILLETTAELVLGAAFLFATLATLGRAQHLATNGQDAADAAAVTSG